MATASEGTGRVPTYEGLTDGHSQEFTIMANIKQGHAPKLRAILADYRDSPHARPVMEEIGTLHDARDVVFDNETRYMFASVFDGDWDKYIDDFLVTEAGVKFNTTLSYCEGYPGLTDPNVKEWLAAHSIVADSFRSAYPDLTVRQIWKQQRAYEAFQAVLDTPEFRAALDNPANAALVATPAFQALLNEAAG